MKVSVVIPCYNEQSTISQIVHVVKAAPVSDLENILVDDCSTAWQDGVRAVYAIIKYNLFA